MTKSGQESQEQYQKYKNFLSKDPVKYAGQIATLKQLEKSNVNYIVNVTSKELDGSHEAEGKTSTDGTNVFVTIRNIGGPQGEKFSMAGRFAHEFEHARQFDDGEFNFVKTVSGKWAPDPKTYDLYDEVRAFNAQLGVSLPIQDTAMLRTLRNSRLSVTFLWGEPKGTLVRPNPMHPDVFGRVHR